MISDMVILFFSIAFVVAVTLGVSYAIYVMAFRPPRNREDDYMALPEGRQYEVYAEETARLCRAFAAIPYESVEITSVDGYRLFGRYYETRKGADLQIECHGYHGSPIRDFCGGNRIARESGYNTLVIEERGMLRSEGRAITFGVMERWDVKSWCEYAAARFGRDMRIVLSGISMGASAVLMASALELPENVVAVIADCPYTRPMDIIKKVGRDMHLPSTVLSPFVKLAARIFGGFSIDGASCVDAVEKTRLPILLIHGTDDLFVPYRMSEEIADANPRIRFSSFPGAGHGLSYMVDTPRYEKVVGQFLLDVGLGTPKNVD